MVNILYFLLQKTLCLLLWRSWQADWYCVREGGVTTSWDGCQSAKWISWTVWTPSVGVIMELSVGVWNCNLALITSSCRMYIQLNTTVVVVITAFIFSNRGDFLMDDCHGTVSVSTFKTFYETCEGILKYMRRRSNIYCWILWSTFPLYLPYTV